MKKINRAYEILSNPVLRVQYNQHDSQGPPTSASHVSADGKSFRRAKKTPWTEWPEGISFPQWRPSPPGAWPSGRPTAQETPPERDVTRESPQPQSSPRPGRNLSQEERLSQDFSRGGEPPDEAPSHPPRSENKHRDQEHQVSGPEGPPCMMYDLRLPVPHPRRRKAEEIGSLEVDIQEQHVQNDQAGTLPHGIERPWSWLKLPPQKRKLVEDEFEDARERF
jgi:hypothetical protein